MLTKLTQELTTYYERGSTPVNNMRAAVALRSALDNMQGDLEAAWWEHFESASPGRSAGCSTATSR